jgi:exoribonuclease-2
LHVGDKVEIELPDGNHARVRAKDIVLLHPGPLGSLAELEGEAGRLVAQTDQVVLAWEILSDAGGVQYDLAEMAELIYGGFTPADAWATWKWLDDGLYFRGSVDAILPCTPEEVQRELAVRQERQVEARAWHNFIERARHSRPGHMQIDAQADQDYLREVEELALGRRAQSRVLRELGRGERPESAHAFLLACGYWDDRVVPYPARLGLADRAPQIELPALPEEQRLDLTHLEAFAVDDRDNQDPDDAISLEACELDPQGRFLGGRIWVHVADASALVAPDTPADLEARGRGATLYLPEGAVPMLPPQAVSTLGLGLQELSPALSFALELDAEGAINDVKIHPSWVRVRRLSYEDADLRLGDDPFRGLNMLASVYQSRRSANGALWIDLPEVIVRVIAGEVIVRPVPPLRSRQLVRETMLMVGEAAARFAIRHEIPFPFAIQEAPDLEIQPREGMADPRLGLAPGAEPSMAISYAMRRALQRSQVSGHPGPHAGVGLPVYCRATSPLRRYLDLVVHQQLRAYLRGGIIFNQDEMLQRVGASEAVIGKLNLAESLVRRHWTLVYLSQHPDWQGDGVVVEKHGLHGRVIIPELALETPVSLRQDAPLDAVVRLKLKGINLPDLEGYFFQV